MLIDELRDLRYFVEVARRRSFSTAAVRLSVSPGAVSKAVMRLEQRMAVNLLVRSSHGLRLSPEGQRLFDHVDGSYVGLERRWEEACRTRDNVAGIVYLSTFTVYGRTRLAPLLPKFIADHSEIELVISFHDTSRGLSRERSDVRITWNENLDDDKVAHKLGKLPLIMVATPAYLAAHGTPAVPGDLEGHECIGGLGATGSRIRWLFTPRDTPDAVPFVLTPRGHITVMDEMGAVTDFVRANLGLTIVYPLEVKADLVEGTMVRVLANYIVTSNEPENAEIILQHRPRSKLSRAASLLVDFIIANHRDGNAD